MQKTVIILGILLSGIFLFSLGCSKGSSSPTETTGNTSTTDTTKQNTDTTITDTTKTNTDTTKTTLIFTPTSAPTDNSVFLDPVSISKDEITLAIKIKGGMSVYGAAIEIVYDSTKLSYISAAEGDFIKKDGSSTSFYASLYRGQNGVVLIGIDRKGDVVGTYGDGTIGTMILKVLGIQTSTTIDFNTNNSVLKSPTGNIIGTRWIGGNLGY